jgi:8-hydroxy-5-deazaflavin:NADPH oxidoreductase
MKIGIIGAGNIGGNLAHLFVQHGHDVSIANSRGPATLTEVAERTGATPVEVADAARDADVVVVTTPLVAVGRLPKGILDAAKADAAVIDTCNYYPQRDGRIGPIDNGETSSRWVSDQLGRRVVKVFNTIYASDLLSRPQPPGTPNRRALPVAGDDTAAKQRVLELVDEVGFDTVDIGGLDESWRFEPGTPAYGPDVDAAALVTLLNQAERTDVAQQ